MIARLFLRQHKAIKFAVKLIHGKYYFVDKLMERISRKTRVTDNLFS